MRVDFIVHILLKSLYGNESRALILNALDVLENVIKNNKNESPDNNVVNNLDILTKNLNESKELLDKTLQEIESQKKTFEQLREQAEVSEQISKLNDDQIKALGFVLKGTLNEQEKESRSAVIKKDLFFCVLSAILGAVFGYILARILEK